MGKAGTSRTTNPADIVLRKLAHGFYFVIPTTTQPKHGSWYVPFRLAKRDMIACLHQARAVDHRRLSSRMGKMDDDDFARVKASVSTLFLK